MTRTAPLARAGILASAITLALSGCSDDDTLSTIALAALGTYDSGLGEGASEIVTFDDATGRVFVVNAEDNSVDVLDITDPSAPTKSGEIPLDAYGSGANSVAAKSGLVAVAVENEVGGVQQRGNVAVFDAATLALVGNYQVGSLPDMVTFTPDGAKVIVANEGEPNDRYTVDPEGTVSVIDIAAGAVTEIDFSAFNVGGARNGEVAGVRVFGPGASVAQDLEPEYIAVSEDGGTAFVSLQENNALVEIDLGSNTISAIRALGTKDYGVAGNAIDASDKDDAFTLSTWPGVVGMYQPDAIATFTDGGTQYVVTANEGDARDYWFDAVDEAECLAAGGLEFDSDDGCLAFTEEYRAEDFTQGDGATLDPAAPTFAAAQDDAQLGRLKVTTTEGDTDSDGDVDVLYSYGARSFSIWGPDGLVYDSGDDFVTHVVAVKGETAFVDDNDGRSDDKGVEPEAVVVGEVDGRRYAFIGLERAGGIMVYNIDDPQAPEFVEYNLGLAGDISPEGMVFIPADQSPNGEALLVVSHEVSGTVTTFEIQVVAQ